MTRPALKLGPAFKSEIEEQVAAQLAREGIGFKYEGTVLHFTIPAFEAKYKPDFPIRDTNIIIETKGRFGHRGSGGAEVRQRLCLVKEQHPELDIRILFSSARAANLPIYKGSSTTQGKWATDHNFPWACKIVPPKWIEEMKHVRHGTSAPVARKRSETVSARKDRSASSGKR